MVIALLPLKRPALHVVIAVAATEGTAATATNRTLHRPTLRQGALGPVGAAAAVPVAAEDPGGRLQVRQCPTRLLR